ncbi:amidase [Aquincola sp. S2]|uniref:Amidase n=1 Tax=Pseudaquabacterium terrae TaxID=2732868 RepID=A0ABX2EE99_9BURK|nr:amidase family protein [Aquabacterium terrae]NRF66936.1 amidase [Aquabacterium terrae]
MPERLDPLGTIVDYHAALGAGWLRAGEALELACANAQAPDGEGARVFARHDADIARASAVQLQRSGGRQLRGPLDRVIVSIKDNFDIAGQVTSAGSPTREGGTPAARDAAAVARLRSAGAILVGRTRMSEFAYSVTGTHPDYPPPRNPWQRAIGRIPGGSTSGGAVSVSDRMAHIALGTDTGGSLRVPAALCGLVGFRPSLGRVPSEGLFPLSPASDTIGAMARAVDDCWRVDSVVAERPLAPRRDRAPRSFHFAVPDGLFTAQLAPPVAAAFERLLAVIGRSGASVRRLPMPVFDTLAPLQADGGITAAEAWRAHGDGGALLACRDPLVRARILMGARTDDWRLAQLKRERAALMRRFGRELRGFDALLAPTVPITAPTIAEADGAGPAAQQINQQLLRNTVAITLVGGCAISLPCHAAGNAPVGAMLAAPGGHDERLFEAAFFIESLLRFAQE